MKLPRGVGLGWRPETAWLIDQRRDLAFSEVIAENVDPRNPTRALRQLVDRGMTVIPHGVSLGLGGAETPEPNRLEHLARVAEALKAPFVSEHVAFVRSSGLEAGHLLPVPRTREALDILIENVTLAQRALPVPLVLENVAAIFEWPDAELSEAEFLRELLRATSSGWLFDVANLYANSENHGWDVGRFLSEAPLERIVYAHIAGGESRGGVYHDTHAHPLMAPPRELLRRVLLHTGPLPLLLERDRDFGERSELEAELDELSNILRHCPAPQPGAVREATL